MAANEGPSPILRVTVDSPVYTADAQKIGKVKEIRGDSFKVDAGFLQRDYWLPARTIASATPDFGVELAVEKRQVQQYKEREPAAA